jgi:very-short-patch-repair endonuclease
MNTPPEKIREGLAAALDAVRKELLDLGLRNPLLNYRALKSRGLEFQGARGADTFQALVGTGEHFTFRSLEDGPAPSSADDHVVKPVFHTALSAKQLEARLLATYYAARTSLEEQGVNTLFLAIGMLCWLEDDNSEEVHRAPLILIPVELERANARERFRMKYNGDEIGTNVSLAELVKQSFSIRLPEMPEIEDLNVSEYLEAVAKEVSGQRRWSVDRESIVLGFFSFSKFLMYRDLDPATWPAEKSLLAQGLLENLLGVGNLGGNGSAYSKSDFVDDHLGKGSSQQVVDADSSQTIALLDVAAGHNMVIQGPPGTGKSQTIVNAIAEALGAGKRVLFVSEKMAALDVVKRRLDYVGLGPACLELHSNKTNKKAVIEELKRTMHVRPPQTPRVESEMAALDETRRRLNEYCQAVNQPVGKSGETPCSLYGQLLPLQSRLAQVVPPSLDMPGCTEWTETELQRKRGAVSSLQSRLSRCGVPSENPFWGSRLRFFLPIHGERVQRALLRGAEAIRKLILAGDACAALLNIPAPVRLDEAKLIDATTAALIANPQLGEVDPAAPEWAARGCDVRQALLAGQQLCEIQGIWIGQLAESAWLAEVGSLRKDLEETGGKWWRFLSPRWRGAMRGGRCLFRDPTKATASEIIRASDAILQSSRIRAMLASLAPTLSSLFGREWQAEKSDWKRLVAQLDWIESSTEGVRKGSIAPWCLDPARVRLDHGKIGQQGATLRLAIAETENAAAEIEKVLELDAGSAIDGGLAELADGWRVMASRLDELSSLVAYNQATDECQSESLQMVVELADVWEGAAAHLADLFERTHVSELLELAFRERPALASFDGLEQSAFVDKFRRLDVRQIELSRLVIALSHARRLPAANSGNGQIAVLWHEFEKKGRFMPLRKLMARAGNVIQAIKPVFMMSPLSIANFVPPGALEFDLVIFDEASQVRPADALGAIVRGHQAVVVGDSKQLPPTSFFDTLIAQESDPEDEEQATADIESVLGLFCARGAHQRMLRWHYRSRHESLIAVSNHLFYDDRLIVFPSPDLERKSLGLIYRRLENAPYDRSRTRTNPGEARAVAVAVMEHARAQLGKPERLQLTLGVAAFSVAQMDAILAEVEILRRQEPACEPFFGTHSHERFFVKNLENVQGDERDVIFISIGYGRTAEGYLAMSFGPLNRSGGERRLNVLITRARQRCEVFTTLGPEDIDTDRSTASGVAALKTFLNYAATGKLDVPVQTLRPQDSAFEEQVLAALQREGYTVHAQVGCAGFFLDLAVVDDEHPGRYLLGIECDGAAYHNARSARDRDRLRQTVLEGLNWSIHRIWSTEWFRNPARELKKVMEAIAGAKERLGRPAEVETRPCAPAPEIVEQSYAVEEPSQDQKGAVKYRMANLHIDLKDVDLHLVSADQISLWLAQVVDVESPVFWLEATRRVAAAAGVARIGSRIQEAFEHALHNGSGCGRFQVKDGFLWKKDMEAPPVRDRAGLPQSCKKIEYISPEEIRAAIVQIAQESFGATPSEIAHGACRLFGFGRVTDDVRLVIDQNRDELLGAGVLGQRGESFVFTSRAKVLETDRGAE